MQVEVVVHGNLHDKRAKVPEEVIRRLPANLQRLFSPLPPAGARPSI
jgi:hypothetical protein